jgi:hypothetical protein
VEKALIFSKRLTILHIDAGDLPQTVLLCRLEETAAFITNAREDPYALVLMHRLMRALGVRTYS